VVCSGLVVPRRRRWDRRRSHPSTEDGNASWAILGPWKTISEQAPVHDSDCLDCRHDVADRVSTHRVCRIAELALDARKPSGSV
jgi:hypothetical protein